MKGLKMTIFSRTDIQPAWGVVCKIENKGRGGAHPVTRTVYFVDRATAIAFRNQVYMLDLAAWKRRRAEARAARQAGQPVTRPSKIARPQMLAICWDTLSLAFVKLHGDFLREQSNRASSIASVI